MKPDFVIRVDVVNEDVRVFVDLADWLVGPEHGEAVQVVLRQRAAVGHPAADEDVLDEEVGQLGSRIKFISSICDQLKI